jgi:hypothetical protein
MIKHEGKETIRRKTRKIMWEEKLKIRNGAKISNQVERNKNGTKRRKEKCKRCKREKGK